MGRLRAAFSFSLLVVLADFRFVNKYCLVFQIANLARDLDWYLHVRAENNSLA
jgi:hypothetical protein